jgi:hypothetical protein
MASTNAAASSDLHEQAAMPLRVEIESNGAIAMQLAFTCEQPCTVIRAVAHGGTPPYTFTWEDGSSAATRIVCPAGTTRYAIMATDTQSSSTNTQAPALTAAADLTAVVPECKPPPGAAKPPPVQVPVSTTTLCQMADARRATPDLAARGCANTIWTLISEPMNAGQKREIRVMGRGLVEGRWRVELWGSPDGCMLAEKLGEFSIAQGTVNTKVSLLPMRDHQMLVLNALEEVDSDFFTPDLDFEMCTETTAATP